MTTKKAFKEEIVRVKHYLQNALAAKSETGLRNSVRIYTIPLLEKLEQEL